MDFNMVDSNAFTADPSLTASADPTLLTDKVDPGFFNTPKGQMLISLLAQVGAKASEPGSIGRAMGEVTSSMMGARAKNEANAGMGATAPQPTTPIRPNPLDVAKQHSNYASLVKKASEFNSQGFQIDPLVKAFQQNPEVATNPTVPTTSPESNVAGAAPVTQAPPIAQQQQHERVAQAFSGYGAQAPIDPFTAMTMGPEGVQAAYDYGLAARKQAFDDTRLPTEINKNVALTAAYDADAKYKNWEISPEGQAFKLRYAGEPTRLAHELEMKKREVEKAEMEDMIRTQGLERQRPSWLPSGIKSTAQFMRIFTQDKAAGQGMIQAWDTMQRAGAELEAARIRAAASGQEMQFQKDMSLYEKFNKDLAIYGATIPDADWGKLSEIEKMTAKRRTKDIEESMGQAKRMRDAIGGRLFGPTYKSMVEIEKKVDTNKLIITRDMLKGDKNKHKEAFSDLFGSNDGKYRDPAADIKNGLKWLFSGPEDPRKLAGGDSY